jgi:hypothetical protein
MTARACAFTTLFLLGWTASASQLIVNGSFETGDLTGWTATDTGGLGDFSVTKFLFTPLTGNGTVGPQDGGFYAVSDDYGPQTEDLTQTFTVPLGTTTALLSFSMFVNDVYGGDFGSSGPGGSVFLLSSTNALITSFYSADTFDSPVGNPNPWVTMSNIDVMPFLTPGSTYTLDFQETDVTSLINVGVDNVSLVTTAVAQAPEPDTLIPGALLTALIIWRSRKLGVPGAARTV